jgi:hypothetical protein
MRRGEHPDRRVKEEYQQFVELLEVCLISYFVVVVFGTVLTTVVLHLSLSLSSHIIINSFQRYTHLSLSTWQQSHADGTPSSRLTKSKFKADVQYHTRWTYLLHFSTVMCFEDRDDAHEGGGPGPPQTSLAEPDLFQPRGCLLPVCMYLEADL